MMESNVIKWSKHALAALTILIACGGINLLPARADSTLWETQKGMKENIAPVFGGAEEVDVREVTANLIKAFLGLLAIIFIILLILAGYKYMMARGDSGKTEEAVDQIKTAIIGLLIILAAYSITYFVFTNLINATGNR